MTEKMFSKVLLLLGFASLVHAAFSAAHHRTYLRLTEQDWNELPLDIIVQTIVSLVIVVYNVIDIVSNFKEIRATVDMQEKSWDTLMNFPGFYTFNHRGRAMVPGYQPNTRSSPNWESVTDGAASSSSGSYYRDAAE